MCRRIASLKVAMKQYAVQTGCSAIAIQCWSSLQEAMGIMPCLANAILTDEQIPVTCETDIHGAITSVMVQAATMNQAPTFFADLTVRHPDNPNGELLFHCGNFPVSLSVEGKPKLRKHFLFDDHAPGTHEGEDHGRRHDAGQVRRGPWRLSAVPWPCTRYSRTFYTRLLRLGRGERLAAMGRKAGQGSICSSCSGNTCQMRSPRSTKHATTSPD